MLVAVGLALYGAMFVSFAITDGDIAEAVGGIGLVLAGVGVFLATRGPSWSR